MKNYTDIQNPPMSKEVKKKLSDYKKILQKKLEDS